MFVCKNCIDKFEPVVALATFYKTCEICGEMRDCLDLAPNVKRIDTPKILELIIEHKDGKFINWSMRDPNDPTRKFGEDDVALIRKVCKAMIESPAEKPCPKCGKFMTWHEKQVGYCFKCHPHEPPTEFCDWCCGPMKCKMEEIEVWYCPECMEFPPPPEEPECDHCAGTGEAKLDEFGDVLYSGEFGPCPYCNIPAPPGEIVKGIIRRHALDPLCLECYQAIKEGKHECPKCHQVLLPREDPPPAEEYPCDTGPDHHGYCTVPPLSRHPTLCREACDRHVCPAEEPVISPDHVIPIKNPENKN